MGYNMKKEVLKLLDYKADVKIIKALADENRLAILQLLKSGEKCGCVLLEELNITQPTLSHHMKILCDANIVDSKKSGKWMHYSICTDIKPKLLDIVQKYTSIESNITSCNTKHNCDIN